MKREITPPIAAVLIGIAVPVLIGVFWKAAVGPSLKVDNSPRPRQGRT